MEGVVGLVILGWAVCWAVLGYFIGNGKGRGEEGAALGFFLGPIGILIAAMMGAKRTPGREADGASSSVRTRCRYCRESVALDATVCPHCQKDIVPACNVICSSCGNGFNLAPVALGHITRCPRCRNMTPTKRPVALTPDPDHDFLPVFRDARADKVTRLQ